MKNSRIKFLGVIFTLLLASCSKDDDSAVIGITSFEKEEEWTCELGETCEDIYQFEFKKDSKISISIEDVTGLSVVTVKLAADFGQYGGPNLLNQGNLAYHSCSGQEEGVSFANVLISETAIYNLSIARDWGQSAGVSGTYKLTIISDTTFQETTAAIQNTVATNYEKECL